MQNLTAINNVCSQLIQSCEKIQSISSGMIMVEQTAPELLAQYESIRFDELEHTQILTLMLTKLVSATADENQDSDGSVFAAGELAAHKESEDAE